MPGDPAWLRSYVVKESNGSLGMVCVFRVSSPDKIREHSSRALLPIDEIVQVTETVIVRADPA